MTPFSAGKVAPNGHGLHLTMTDIDGVALRLGQRVVTRAFGTCTLREFLQPDNGSGHGASVRVCDSLGNLRTIRLHVAGARWLPPNADNDRITMIPDGII